MNVRVSVGGEDNNGSDSDSDSELAQVKQKVEDEGDPWAANEDRPSEESLLLSAKGETGLGGLGDDVSHRVRKYYAICFWTFHIILQGGASGQIEGWVDLDLGVPLARGALKWLPTAQAGWWNIPNLTQHNPTNTAVGPPCM